MKPQTLKNQLDKRFATIWCKVVEPEKAYGAYLLISAEDGEIADYYGEFRDGDMWVNADVEKAIEAAGYYLDWIDAGTIGVFK